MEFKGIPLHESAGMIGISHVSHNGANLFASPIKSLRSVRICVSSARSYDSGIHGRYYSADQIIAEVEMSPTQFAEMITTPNVGTGVPCTLRYYRDGDRLKQCDAPPPFESEATFIRRSFGEQVSEKTATLKATRRRIDSLLEEAKVSQERRKRIADELNAFYRMLTDSAPFVMGQIEEQAAAVTQAAKAEIAGMAEHIARETGIAALRAGIAVPSLEPGAGEP